MKIKNIVEELFVKMEIDCEKHGKVEITAMKGVAKYHCKYCKTEKEQQEKEMQAKIENEKMKKAKQEKIIANFKSALIPPRFQEYNFDNFIENDDRDKINKKAMFDYAINFDNNLKNGSSIILSGTIGTGKTHLSCAVANYIIKNLNKTALFLNTIDAFGKIKATYSKKSEITEIDALNQFIDVDLLILDEFGVQYGTEAEKMILFRIINKRYENLKPTILITNLATAELKKIDERVFDRMRHNGLLLVFNGESKRKNKVNSYPLKLSNQLHS